MHARMHACICMHVCMHASSLTPRDRGASALRCNISNPSKCSGVETNVFWQASSWCEQCTLNASWFSDRHGMNAWQGPRRAKNCYENPKLRRKPRQFERTYVFSVSQYPQVVTQKESTVRAELCGCGARSTIRFSYFFLRTEKLCMLLLVL